MEFQLLHLYPDLMGLYGEWANVAVLRRHLEDLGHGVTVSYDGDRLADADFVFMGAGTERSQKVVLEDFRRYAQPLAQAMNADVPLLFTGTAFELLGREIVDAKGRRYEGLGLADFTVEETDKRIVGDVYGPCGLVDTPVVGFLNKCSLIRGVTTPFLSRCELGFGNETDHGAEGYCARRLLGTHLTGPVLAKNPALTRFFVEALYAQRGEALPAQWPDYPFEQQGYEVTISELRKLP